jgi:hypothetical protein
MKFYSRIILLLLLACAAIQLSFFVAAWSAALPPGSFMQISAKGMSVEQMRAMDPAQRLACAAVGLAPLLALAYGLLRLARLLANVRRGALFDRATIGHLRAFAGATLLSTVLSIVEPPVRTLLLRFGFGVPSTGISIGINSEELMLLLVCALFFLVTNLLHEGRRLAEENEGFV